ncbi:META domain-containing protein [Spirosoma sp.]|uniref:META domain-containing protein n=1 Tax=Spirosoma sp. TaxID=1899569 RepID=UPI003B3A9CB1
MQNRWILVELDGQPVIHEGTNQQASLEFTAEENKVTGSTGCNRLFGSFVLSGDEEIRLNEIGSTKMACPDMTIENNFLKALSVTNAYSISGKELLLKNGDAVVARLRAEPSSTK